MLCGKIKYYSINESMSVLYSCVMHWILSSYLPNVPSFWQGQLNFSSVQLGTPYNNINLLGKFQRGGVHIPLCRVNWILAHHQVPGTCPSPFSGNVSKLFHIRNLRKILF